MSEVMVLLAVHTSCHIQGICSAIYALASTQHVKLSCMRMVNGYSTLVREIEERLVPGHGEVSFWLIESLELH